MKLKSTRETYPKLEQSFINKQIGRLEIGENFLESAEYLVDGCFVAIGRPVKLNTHLDGQKTALSTNNINGGMVVV